MKGRNPTKAEKEWMGKVADMGCIICLNEHHVFSPAAIHHIDGKTKEGAHLRILPLCWLHHQSGRNDIECVSRHPHKAEFERRYGTENELLEQIK